jgi:hypothetical protein
MDGLVLIVVMDETVVKQQDQVVKLMEELH